GEPLVAGQDFYRQAFDIVARLKPDDVVVRHGINTNATLIDDSWSALLKEYDINVGVSIDGPRELHDAYRVTRAGAGTFDATVRGLRMLRDAGVRHYVLSVLTEQSLRSAQALFNFFVEERVRFVCFNVEEIEGANTKSSLKGPEQEALYDTFLR